MSNLGDGISLIAYPWLASALTRNPILISGVVVAQRLPWLIVSLPVGVAVDRGNRRSLMVAANGLRAVLTTIVGLAVWRGQNSLPAPEILGSLEILEPRPERLSIYAMLILASFLLGIGEVVHDTSAITILPQIVDRERLLRANGRLSSIEQAANFFLGPPLGALLLSGAFALPFLFDAATFAASAAVLATLSGSFQGQESSWSDPELSTYARFRSELRVGYRALRDNTYLWLFAVVTTIINLTGAMIFAIMVFFAQDVLGAGPAEFAVLTIGSAVGSVLGGIIAAPLAQRIGTGTALRLAALAMGFSLLAIGLAASWLLTAVFLGFYGLSLVVWVVQTVSFRQAVTPNELLGRVNGVYRFFSFGAIPLGAIFGGLVVALVEAEQGREMALRTPFVLAGGIQLLTILAVAPRLANRSIADAQSNSDTEAATR